MELSRWDMGRAQSQEAWARREDHLGLTEGSQAQSPLRRTRGAALSRCRREGQPEGGRTGSGPLDGTCCHALFHLRVLIHLELLLHCLGRE